MEVIAKFENEAISNADAIVKLESELVEMKKLDKIIERLEKELAFANEKALVTA